TKARRAPRHMRTHRARCPQKPRDVRRPKTSWRASPIDPLFVWSIPMAKDLKFNAAERLQQMEELLTKHGLVRDRHGFWIDPKARSIARTAETPKQREAADADKLPKRS